MSERASLLIRCSKEEAEMIRRAARLERRTISGFILNAVSTRLQAHLRKPPEPRQPKPAAAPEQR